MLVTLALVLIVFAAFTTEAATGFGSMLVAVTFGALLLPLQEGVALMVPLGLLLSTYLVVRYHAHVAFRLLLTRVLPLMGVGLVLGQLAFRHLSTGWLERGLGVLVAVLSARELYRFARPAQALARPLHPAAASASLVGGGVMHGLYGMGGPLLVYVLGRSQMEKAAFRSTLAVVWLVLNGALTAVFLVGGRLTAASVPRLALLVPAVLVAVAVGELLHARVDERRFRAGVFALLLIAGISLAV